MNFKIAIVLITICSICRGQTKPISFCDDSDSLILKKLYLIGENHVQSGNVEIGIGFHRFMLKHNIVPNYVFVEEGPSFAFILNTYLKTNDNNCLEILAPNSTERTIYNNYRNFYDSLDPDKKFTVIGTDIERFNYFIHFAIGYIIRSCAKKNNFKIDYNNPDYQRLESFYLAINHFLIFDKPQYTSNKTLKSGLNTIYELYNSKDSVDLKEFLKEEYKSFLGIIHSYNFSKEHSKTSFFAFASNNFHKLREQRMADNIYQIYLNDSNAIGLGVFGSDHILHTNYKKTNRSQDKIRIGNSLNQSSNYPILNHNVNSTVIYYSGFKRKYYKFVNTDLSHIEQEFTKMFNCNLYLKKVKSDRVDNLLLFKQF